MKISIITVCYNSAQTISDTLQSVGDQTYKDIEHIIIDGGSTDRTLEIVAVHGGHVAKLISEKDNGIYDAMNKGITLATGDVIGFLNSDDVFAEVDVVSTIAKTMADPSIDACYGDLDYLLRTDTSSIVRHWSSGEFSQKKLKKGWMPPHPTLFLRRTVIENWGGFDTSFKISADYDAILRYFSQGKIQTAYIPRVLTKMRMGGVSNQTLAKVWLKTREDYIALRRNRIGGVWVLLNKNLRKVSQFWLRST